jgi:hypothetical protein
VQTRIFLALLSLLLCACAVTKPQTVQEEMSDAERRCCAQCGDAASKDPAGRDIGLDACAGYIGYVVNGQAPLDPACGDWFKAHPHTVADCR